MIKIVSNITLEQIEQEIIDGKVDMIFYSANTPWWTHSRDDLKEATERGREVQEIQLRKAVGQQKERLKGLLNAARTGAGIPLDPTGSPLYQTDDPKKWIQTATSKPDHYGEFGISALMAAHHRNCIYREKKDQARPIAMTTWEDYSKRYHLSGKPEIVGNFQNFQK